MSDAFFIGLGVVGFLIGVTFALFMAFIGVCELAAWWRRRRVRRVCERLFRDARREVVALERARRQEREVAARLLPTSQRRVRREPCGAPGRDPAGK